ncbi:radical SAM protein [Geobacter sp. AOG1]|uniref:radical SAM protein n=1 Tax=Geobacter sp. AOG1 TaxID=1566346 RepID=UPI001CC68412|nr:radical SAM protein [Geobacter sp. AOG1]GFE56438.1 coenzyme PQQ synthesis protein E [Geobacter sp. AOG1]
MIRRNLRDIIAKKVSKNGLGWLARRSQQYLLLHLSDLLHRPLCGPALGTIMVTYRCNYDCAMCDMPRKGATQAMEGLQEFDTERFRRIISEFARLGTAGIGFTGGEPLLREDIFELLACTRKHGMIAHLNTNGYYLGDTEARRIIEAGTDSVNISLDGATPATHDRIRNRSGAFERAATAIDRLHRLRRQQKSPLRLKIVAVIDETNIEEAPELIHLSRELGADSMDFIPRQPFAPNLSGSGNLPDDMLLARVDRLVDALLQAREEGASIENSPAHLRLFRSSFAGRPSPVRCRAGYNSLAVDCYGRVFPCVPWINWGKFIANVQQGSLVDVWHSAEYQQHRTVVSRCRDCYLNCQTELNLLFDPLAHLRIRWRKN